MFLAPVLSALRAPGFGSAFGVATLFIGSCSVLPNETDTLRVKRVEEAVLPMARIALEAEQTETARRLYLRLLDVDPGSVTARMGLGDIAVARRDSSEAARWYAAAAVLAPRGEERQAALLAHGRAALAGGELDAARKSFARLTSAREGAPGESVAWGLNGLGLVALLEGDIRGAIRLMEQAVLLAPEEPMLSDNLSRALDLSAGMAPQADGADPMRDMVAAPPGSAPPPVEQVVVEDRAPQMPNREADRAREAEADRTRRAPNRAGEAETDRTRRAPNRAGEAETDRTRQAPNRVEESEADRTRRAPNRRADRTREARRPEANAPRTDVARTERPIDQSELRPYAIKVGGEFWVRIGAYDRRSEARAVAAELGGVTAEPVDVVEFGMADGRNAVRLYRVLVGPIASSAGLIELVAALDDLGYGAARVPPSVASGPERTAVPDPASRAGRRAAGPELVEVSLQTAGDEDVEGSGAAAGTAVDAATEGSAEGKADDLARSRSAAGSSGVATAGVEREVGRAREDSGGAVEPVAGEADSEALAEAEAMADDSAGLRGAGGSSGVATPGVEWEVGRARAESEVAVEPVAGEVDSEGSAEAMADGSDPSPGVEREGGPAPSEAEGPATAPSAEEAPSRGRALSEATARGGVSSADVPGLVGSADATDAPRFLQVGAYTVRSTAEALAAEVGGVARAPVRVIEAELSNGDTMYRVQVGPIGSRERMAELGEKLVAGGYGTVRVLPDPAADGTGDVRAAAPRPAAPPQLPQRRVRAFVTQEGERRFLQMGAYAIRSTADTLASQLRLATSERVYIEEAPNDDGLSLYRVRIGPIGSDAALAALLAALRPGYGAGWSLPEVETDARRTAFVVHEDSGRFLQMGAYATRSAANALVSELRGRIDGEVRITQAARGSGDPVYRVRVGPIDSDAYLAALVEAVESMGYIAD